MSYAAHAARCVRPSWNSILEADFTKDAYSRPGRRFGAFTSIPNSSFSRALAAESQDLAGTWVQAASGIYRRTNRGTLLEEQRANSIRNSALSGAGVGTPPTYWAPLSPSNGVTKNIVGVGTEYGLPYVDFAIQGTATATANIFQNLDGATNGMLASEGQIYATSLFARIISNNGATPTSFRFTGEPRDAAGAQITGTTSVSVLYTPTTSFARYETTAAITASGGTIGRLLPYLAFGLTNGQAYDLVLRVYCPQMEVVTSTSQKASSPILTNGASLTRPKDPMRLTSTPVVAPWTIYSEAEFLGDTGAAQSMIYVSAASSSNDRVMMFRSSSGGLTFNAISGGSTVLNRNVAKLGARTVKSAVSFDGTTYLCACDGSGLASTAAAGPAQQLDQIDLGQNNGTNSQLNGYLRRVSIRPYAAGQAELNALTA